MRVSIGQWQWILWILHTLWTLHVDWKWKNISLSTIRKISQLPAPLIKNTRDCDTNKNATTKIRFEIRWCFRFLFFCVFFMFCYNQKRGNWVTRWHLNPWYCFPESSKIFSCFSSCSFLVLSLENPTLPLSDCVKKILVSVLFSW